MKNIDDIRYLESHFFPIRDSIERSQIDFLYGTISDFGPADVLYRISHYKKLSKGVIYLLEENGPFIAEAKRLMSKNNYALVSLFALWIIHSSIWDYSLKDLSLKERVARNLLRWTPYAPLMAQEYQLVLWPFNTKDSPIVFSIYEKAISPFVYLYELNPPNTFTNDAINILRQFSPHSLKKNT